jgi:hypothetical protein
MSTTQAPPDTDRRVAIDFLYLDISSCSRCQGTGDNLELALVAVERLLRDTGAEVTVRRTQVQSLQQARELRFEVSPTLRVNGRDIEPIARESPCGPDACGCGEGGSCRVWSYDGQDSDEAPVALIVDAILAALSDGQPAAGADAPAYVAPNSIVRAFARPARNGGGCCG